MDRRSRSGTRKRGSPPLIQSKAAPSEPNWPELLEEYERIHLKIDPLRQVRLDTLLDLLEVSLPRRFVALDLGSGPGTLSQKILERFPAARVALVDHDTVLLNIAREGLRRFGERVHMLRLDLGQEGWERELPFRKVDAVVCSMVFHDLSPYHVRRLYRTVFLLLRPGGLLLNSDYIVEGGDHPGLAELAEQVREVQVRRRYRLPRDEFFEELGEWWKPIRKYPPFREAIARRDRVASKWRPQEVTLDLPTHLKALRRAGFRRFGSVWNVVGSARILLAEK